MQFSSSIQTLLKTAFAILAFGFIAWRLIHFDHPEEAWALFLNQTKQAPVIWILMILVAMPLHWLFEIVKWKRLINKTCELTIKQAITGVISGLTIAMFTPNRIGEIFSRTLILPDHKRPAGIAFSGINALSQFVIVQVFGLIGLALLLIRSEFFERNLHAVSYWGIAIIVLLTPLIIYAFFSPGWIRQLTRLTKSEKKFPGINDAVNQLNNKDKWVTLFWAALKHLTYSLQFFLLLKVFGLNGTLFSVFPVLMTIYLLMNFIPVISIGEAGVKGSLTLLLLGQNPETDLAILAASLVLWILNTAIPALAGAFLLKKIQF